MTLMQNSVNTTPSQVTHTPKNNNAAGSRNTLCNDTCTPRALCVTPSSPRAKPNTPSMIGKPSVAGCNETCTPGDLNVTPSGQRKETATPCNRVVRYPIPSTPCNITSQQRNPNIAGIIRNGNTQHTSYHHKSARNSNWWVLLVWTSLPFACTTCEQLPALMKF